MKKYLLVVLLIAWSSQVFSEDIDLYIKNTSATQRPSVLIILDNSPSMNWYNASTDNLLPNWWLQQVNNPLTRSHVAREIIIDLINDNPEVDFALQLFNSNSTLVHGGRIVFGFKDLSVPANKSELISILDNDTDNTNNNYKEFAGAYTPLCETLYETYRYLSGGEVLYGNDDTDVPQSITSSGDYTSPFAGITCDKEITIIYITDGDPTGDIAANSIVDTLTSTNLGGNRLGVLGNWMATRNWISPFAAISGTKKSDVLASVKIHTVGFGGDISATALLELAARDGVAEVVNPNPTYRNTPAGGKYHQATTAAALKTALETVVIEAKQSSSLTSASVSANSFDRTQTSDSVYYGMFEPSTGARWQGNLKKYKIDNGEQVDANGTAAVNAAGDFDDAAQSFWSPTVDGNEVTQGGVAEMLRAMATEDRTLYTDITGTGELTTFSVATVTGEYNTVEQGEIFDIPSTATNASEAADELANITSHINWAMGVDVDDSDGDSGTDVRFDVFADPLHSKPIVVNYAGLNPRIVVGTNAGVLHMFEDVAATGPAANQVIENWAYLPAEFFKNIKPLRQNIVAPNNKIYGLDGEITLYIDDKNGNGTIDSGDDTAWLFFGLRRGGSSYYALNITNPAAAPTLEWHITNTGDFVELGQTWSKPQVVRSAFNGDSGNLVVIFGGGYDTNKDDSGPSTADALGASVYMVNARTGARILQINTTGIRHGIASSIATLDSDNDTFVDRLYVGDTGGNVWRIDMPDTDEDHNSVWRLASLGGGTNPNDRRFFNQPAIARTYIIETTNVALSGPANIVQHKVPIDAILLGSGDKATPMNGDTLDMFFMIKDRFIKTQRLDQISDTAIIDTITLANLTDYTDDPFENFLTVDLETELLAASLQSGWHFDLEIEGEKNTAEAIVINNVVYFTSYSPKASADVCNVTPGNAWLYAVDLALGIKKYDWGTETDNRDGDDRIKHMGSSYVGKGTLISTPVTTNIIVIDPLTGLPVNKKSTKIQGNLIIGKTVLPVGFNLQTMRTSLTVQGN